MDIRRGLSVGPMINARTVSIVVALAACSGEKKVEYTEVAISGLPKCPENQLLKQPIAITAEMGDARHYVGYTGWGKPAVTVRKAKGEVRIRYGYCPNAPAQHYRCAQNKDDGVRYYNERK